MPHLQITGVLRAGTDPDLKFSPSGLAIATVRAVASRSKKNDNDEWEDIEPSWYKVTAFGPLAELLADKIEKGKRFHIMGDHSIEEWETKEGEKRTTDKIVARALFPYEERNQGGGQARQRQGNTQSAPQQESPWGPQQTGDPWGTAPSSSEPPF